MKYLITHITLFLSLTFVLGQQTICRFSEKLYSVDIQENNGSGTTGSIYYWSINSPNFEGEITPQTSTGNQVIINWSSTPTGTYSLLVIENNNGCENSSTLEVTIINGPTFELEPVLLCNLDSSSMLIGPEGYESYLWTDGEGNAIGDQSKVEVFAPGTYYLEVTTELCEYQTQVEVSLEPAPYFEIDSENGTLIVRLNGSYGPYEYQLEDLQGNIIVPFQSSNIFTNLQSNIYIVRTRSVNACEFTMETIVLFIPNIITPNGDGANDEWNLNELTYFENAIVRVYDRYGKFLMELNKANQFIWDGKYMGRALPSDSYWYEIDFGNGKRKTGYVVIKNRNSIY